METAQICLAVNDKRLTQADFIEWLCATLWAGPGKGFLLALAACLGVVLALSVLSAWVDLGLSWDQLWPAGLCVLAAALFAACMPRWMGRLRYRQHLTMTQGAASRRTVFYPQYLEIETNGVVQGRYWYADVKKVIKTKHLMLLKFANQVYCAVRRDGFSQGCWALCASRTAHRAERLAHRLHGVCRAGMIRAEKERWCALRRCIVVSGIV